MLLTSLLFLQGSVDLGNPQVDVVLVRYFLITMVVVIIGWYSRHVDDPLLVIGKALLFPAAFVVVVIAFSVLFGFDNSSALSQSTLNVVLRYFFLPGGFVILALEYYRGAGTYGVDFKESIKSFVVGVAALIFHETYMRYVASPWWVKLSAFPRDAQGQFMDTTSLVALSLATFLVMLFFYPMVFHVEDYMKPKEGDKKEKGSFSTGSFTMIIIIVVIVIAWWFNIPQAIMGQITPSSQPKASAGPELRPWTQVSDETGTYYVPPKDPTPEEVQAGLTQGRAKGYNCRQLSGELAKQYGSHACKVQ